jgi:putative peptidoglycan lipid II flippase
MTTLQMLIARRRSKDHRLVEKSNLRLLEPAARMNLFKSFATVGGWTGVSRVFGFVRDILIARYLGVGDVADAWFTAFAFPNLFRRLFGEGAFNAAFVPLFSGKLEAEGKEAARRFAQEALSVLLVVLVALTAIVEMAMPLLMYVIAPGFADDPEKFDLAILFTRIAFPYLMFMSLTAMLSGLLNSLGKFAIAAGAPVLLNVVLIGSIVLLSPHLPSPGHALVWGVALAGIGQFLLLYWGCARVGMPLRAPRPRLTPGVKRLIQLGVPGVIAGGITQINLLIGQMIATFEDGARSVLAFADRIYQLPLGMIGIAIGVVLLPELSRQLRNGQIDAAERSQNRALEFSMALTLPSAVALGVAPLEIVSVLFQYGAFDGEASRNVARAVQIFAIGLPAFVLVKVFSPAFFAREDTKTPLYFSLANIAVNIIGSFILFFGFGLGFISIVIATTVGAWLNVYLLASRLRTLGHFRWDPRLKSRLPRICASAILMGLAVFFAATGLEPFFGGEVIFRWVALGGLVGAGIVVYGLASQLTGAFTTTDLRESIGGGSTQ